MTLAEPRPAPALVADLGAGNGPEWIDHWLAEHTGDVVAWRRAIHARPELARHEHETTRLCAETLAAAGLRPRLLPGTGLVCDIGEGPRTVALRADMDALPLTEQTDASYSSQVPGVAHMCGHDAHTAMLLGAGRGERDDRPSAADRRHQAGGGEPLVADAGAVELVAQQLGGALLLPGELRVGVQVPPYRHQRARDLVDHGDEVLNGGGTRHPARLPPLRHRRRARPGCPTARRPWASHSWRSVRLAV